MTNKTANTKSIKCPNCSKKFRVAVQKLLDSKISLVRMVEDNQDLFIVMCPLCGFPNHIVLPIIKDDKERIGSNEQERNKTRNIRR